MTAGAGVQINAWIDDETGPVVGEESPALNEWAIRKVGAPIPAKVLYSDVEPDLKDWTSAKVGWGLLLRDDDSVGVVDKANAKDAPAAVQRLLAGRPESPVLRYRPELRFAHLRRYDRDGSVRDLATAGSQRGVGPTQIPQYLLIVGSPDRVPWRLQYTLNPNYFVGRLDLPEEGLSRYVDALLTGWQGSRASRHSALIWAVDHGRDDITWLMRYGLAERLQEEFAADKTVRKLEYLPEAEATHRNLVAALVRESPGIVVTTSHGATPIHLDPQEMRAVLGRLIDQEGHYLHDESLGGWEPDGAVWYSHACCSAGSDTTTLYEDVVDKGSDVHRVLVGVTAAGANTAPLPRYLLGRERPLRAFVGHVEPTFNWTLRNRRSGQLLTSSLLKALYNGLYQQVGEPIGLALHRSYSEVGVLWSQWDNDRDEAARGNYAARERALESRMTALDRQSLVILGDPTVTVAQD